MAPSVITIVDMAERWLAESVGLLIPQLRAILRQLPGLNPTRRVNTRAKWL